MKKTINRLLLAMAVCAGSAYSADWQDDQTIKRYMQDTMNELDGPINVMKDALAAINAVEDRTKAIDQISQLLESLDVDLSSVSGATNPVEQVKAVKKIAKKTIDHIDGLLNGNEQPSKETDPQDHQAHTVSNTPPATAATGGSRKKY